MISGRISGRIWSSRRVDTMPTGALLEVSLEDGNSIVAFDPLGCADGEAVLIVQGSVAAAFFPEIRAPIDALIIASIDEQSRGGH